MIWRRIGVLVTLAVLALPFIGCLASASPGTDVLFLLCDPYGANTALLWINFERLGWNVTVSGTNARVTPCSPLTTDIQVDRTIGQINNIDAYDILVVSPTPGTFNQSVDPAEELRSNPDALELVRQADAAGLALYAGCSALTVLGDAGVLAGHDVIYHASLGAQLCQSFGAASCTRGSTSQLPIRSGNIVTGSNQRYFALEIPEAIARTLDREVPGEPSETFELRELAMVCAPIAPEGVVVSAWAAGTHSSDGAMAACAVEDGFVLVGFTFALGQGDPDVLIMRVADNGNLLWAKALCGPGRDYGYGVVPVEDGFVLAGTTSSAGGGREDVLLAKLSPSGDLVWVSTYGGASDESAYDVAVAANGDLLLAGTAGGEGIQKSAVLLLRTDPNGVERWRCTKDAARLERALSVIECEDGTILVAGGTTSMGFGNYDMLLVAFTADGDELWAKAYGKAQFDIAEQVIALADGGYALVGYGDIDGSDPNDMELVLTTETGTLRKRRTCGPPLGFDYGQGILESTPGTLLIVGATTYPSTGRLNAWILGYSAADGTSLWEQQFGSDDGNEWLNAICRTSDGSIIAAGWTRAVGQGSHDVLVVRIDPEATP